MTLTVDLVSPYQIRQHYASMRDKELKKYYRHDILKLESGSICQIEDGYARTTTLSEDGDVNTLGIWGPGDYLGIPIRRNYPFQIEFLSQTKISLFKGNSGFSHHWVVDYLEQIEALLNIQYQSLVRERLLLFLSWLGDRFGHQVSDGIAIGVRLTHQEISESINSTRVTVTRALKDLEKEGAITWTGRVCVISNSVKL